MTTKKAKLIAETELQPDVVLEMLTKRGLIGDQRIANEKARDTQQQKKQNGVPQYAIALKALSHDCLDASRIPLRKSWSSLLRGSIKSLSVLTLNELTAIASLRTAWRASKRRD